MKLATIKPNDLAIVRSDTLVPVGEALARSGALPKGASMIDLITQYSTIKEAIDARRQWRRHSPGPQDA